MKLLLPKLIIDGPENPKAAFWFNLVKYGLMLAVLLFSFHIKSLDEDFKANQVLNFEYALF